MRKAVEEAEAAKREATAWMRTWSDRNSSGALIIRMGFWGIISLSFRAWVDLLADIKSPAAKGYYTIKI